MLINDSLHRKACSKRTSIGSTPIGFPSETPVRRVRYIGSSPTCLGGSEGRDHSSVNPSLDLPGGPGEMELDAVPGIGRNCDGTRNRRGAAIRHDRVICQKMITRQFQSLAARVCTCRLHGSSPTRRIVHPCVGFAQQGQSSTCGLCDLA